MEYKLRNMEMYFPNVYEHMLRYYETGPFEITIERDDGVWNLYDDLERSIRRLPCHPNDVTEHDIRKEFGIRLRKMMRKEDITQSELAELTGLTQQQISNYMSGKNMPSFAKVDMIARALRCHVDDLRFYDYSINDRK